MLIGAPPMSEPFVDLLRSGINLLASDEHGNVGCADEISEDDINGAFPVDDLGVNLRNLNNSTHPDPRRYHRHAQTHSAYSSGTITVSSPVPSASSGTFQSWPDPTYAAPPPSSTSTSLRSYCR